MDLKPAARLPRTKRLPRTRGDGPESTDPTDPTDPASPHTRGWTCHMPLLHVRRPGFPAHAGMDRAAPCSMAAAVRLPRTRGDGPSSLKVQAAMPTASPHTRGWTRSQYRHGVRRQGFPAHAGMDLASRQPQCQAPRLPRTRGDGPSGSCSPACILKASPHTRGWTSVLLHQTAGAVGFPAHAGMDPSVTRELSPMAWLPRTRGDGPFECVAVVWHGGASPHTRGWTHNAAAEHL